jgi:hypothetical protein
MLQTGDHFSINALSVLRSIYLYNQQSICPDKLRTSVRKAEQEGSLSCRSVYRQAITSAGEKRSVSQLAQQKRSFVTQTGSGQLKRRGRDGVPHRLWCDGSP